MPSQNQKIKPWNLFNQEHSVLIFSSKRTKMLWFVTVLSFFLSVSINITLLTMDIDKELMEYSSLLSFVAFQIFFVIAGNILLVVMIWMSGKYAISIIVNPGNNISVKCWGIFGYRIHTFSVNRIISSTYFAGQSNFAGAPRVNAPWIRLKTDLGNLFIIDMQGEIHHGYEVFNAALKGINK